MNEYILTFGFGQTYKGELMDNHYCRLYADNQKDARNLAYDLFGQQWCNIYDNEDEAGVKEFDLIELKL